MTTHTETALRGDLELLNRTVAELVGWTKIHYYEDNQGPPFWSGIAPASFVETVRREKTYGGELPNFVGSLDACRTFEAGLTYTEQIRFDRLLQRIRREQKVHCLWQLKPPDHCIALCYLRKVITPTTPQ